MKEEIKELKNALKGMLQYAENTDTIIMNPNNHSLIRRLQRENRELTNRARKALKP